MATFVDTNILLRSLNPADPQYESATSALAKLRLRNEALCIAPQILIEFWAVATRPLKQNGLGMSCAEAEMELASIRQFFRLLPYTLDVIEIWRGIIMRFSVSGKQTHDAHLIAVMQAHAITEILTFNVSDFRRFSNISALDPVHT